MKRQLGTLVSIAALLALVACRDGSSGGGGNESGSSKKENNHGSGKKPDKEPPKKRDDEDEYRPTWTTDKPSETRAPAAPLGIVPAARPPESEPESFASHFSAEE